jgi:alcohol dehydrogenase
MMGLVMGFRRPRQPILGMVFSGEVESLGEGADGFTTGDPVYGWTVTSPTKIQMATYAEYICVPEKSVIAHKPVNASHEEAASMIYGGLLASHWINARNIKAGQKVMIYGASGSIGTSAVQLAKHFGAEVTGVCSTANLEMVRSLGADAVIDYTQENAGDIQERYDYILDAVGEKKNSAFKEQVQNLLEKGGIYGSVDRGSPRGSVDHLVLLKELLDGGKYKVLIDRTYPLEEMVEAHRYVDGGHKKGNVAISVYKA